MPVHFALLATAGYDLDADVVDHAVFVEPESRRLAVMRAGHNELVEVTGVDFSYDLAQWREFLLAFDDECGRYKHPYAFRGVDAAIQRAIADPECQRLARVLAGQSA